jgi:hypothetical protein
MGDNLFGFLKGHPLWAALIIIFAVLPIIGLILPLFRKAFGRRGFEQSPSPFEFSSDSGQGDSEHDNNPANDKDEPPSKEA